MCVGGRIALYFSNNHTYIGKMSAYGGQASISGNSNGQTGGAGSVYAYHTGEIHRALIIDNGYRTFQRTINESIESYTNINQDGCVTWLLPEALDHEHAANNSYEFEELQVRQPQRLARLLSTVPYRCGAVRTLPSWRLPQWEQSLPFGLS